MSNERFTKDIERIRSKLGKRLVILGHHYQREEVVEFADFRGDSFGLSKIASEQKEAEFIVFCGVRFMAEAAKILARPEQHVFHPEPSAGCPMADMASLDDVEEAWKTLTQMTDIKKVVPMAYMNTSAEIKAFCGEHGGIICTSSNAPKAFEWAFKRGEKIFFFPDENLGRNTARNFGIPPEQITLYSPNLSTYALKHLRTILWPGYCHVHTFFTLEHVNEVRQRYPGCKIIVHPECKEDVVMASDAAASTEGIVKFVDLQPKGSTIIIGTEINLVSRLSHENSEKRVLPLARSLCPNMFKLSLGHLSRTLSSIERGELSGEVTVPKDVCKNAKLALSNMLTL